MVVPDAVEPVLGECARRCWTPSVVSITSPLLRIFIPRNGVAVADERREEEEVGHVGARREKGVVGVG
jgi:hypothetical protein